MLLKDQVELVQNTAKTFPRIARGHGTRSWQKNCSAPGCNAHGEQHFQNRVDLAIKHLTIDRGLPIDVGAVKYALAIPID